MPQPFDLDAHPHFTAWTDPASGVRSYVLSTHLGPLQKALYYVTPSQRGRRLWFTVRWPPARTAQLAVASLDPAAPELRLLPGIFPRGNPLLAPDGEAAWVPVEDRILRVTPEGEAEEVVRFPEELLGGRHLFRLVTDLTMSADGRCFALDSHVGSRFLIATADVATGEVTPLRWFFKDHHHVAFSPVDPHLLLVNQGPWHDPITGDKGDMDVRMWVMDVRGTRFEPVQSDLWFSHNAMGCHEWWTPDGRLQWCDYADGIYEVDAPGGERRLVWSRPLVHGQTDPTGRYLCGDANPYHWNAARPCSVWVFDRETGREAAVASNLPEPPLPPRERRRYHPDPHPHFSADGAYLVHTTTALGPLSVALVPMAPIRERLA